jgi:GNAT superfamily N-acetyltransferase
MVSLELATTQLFPEVLEWLAAEKERGEAGFYCNRNIIEKSFSSGEGLCALIDGKIVGFVVFKMYANGGDIDIIEVEASFRGLGIGSKLLLAATEALRRLGANYVDVECSSADGESLCRKHSFLDYVDPCNHRNKWDGPLLRLYISDWRPQPPNPWA